MKKLIFFIAILLIPANVLAISEPTVRFIPDNISANSSFLMIVDPHPEDWESVAVHWSVGGEAYGGYYPKTGLLPRVNDKWICYFSSTDPSSTCGPTPFTQATVGYTPYEMIIYAANQNDYVVNTTVPVEVGSIVLTIQINPTENGASITVWADAPVEGVSYTVYRADTLSEVSTGLLEWYQPIRGYTGDVELSDGEYYAAFTASSSSGPDFGGGVVKFNVGAVYEPSYTQIKADSVYWNPVIDLSVSDKASTSRFSITNTGPDTLTDLSARVPSDLSNIMNVVLPSDSLSPNESMHYTITIRNIDSGMDINTNIEILSGSVVIKKIPAHIKVTVKGIGRENFCLGKQDGTYCNGGVCCDETCVQDAQCCPGSTQNCRSDETCENYICVKAASTQCSVGSCFPGESALDCPAGTTYTQETCTISGSPGVCCEEVNPCAGKSDGDSCPNGICCDNVCVQGDCCDDSQCSSGEQCVNHRCTTSEVHTCSVGECLLSCDEGMIPTGESCDLYGSEDGICCVAGGDTGWIVIPIVIGIAAVAGFFIYKKFGSRLFKRGEEEGEEEYFEEEEFY